MYHKREWLNEEGLLATSTITAFHGTAAYYDKDGSSTIEYVVKKIAISDCSRTIRIHQQANESDLEFITKIKKVAHVCLEFVEYLEKL